MMINDFMTFQFYYGCVNVLKLCNVFKL